MGFLHQVLHIVVPETVGAAHFIKRTVVAADQDLEKIFVPGYYFPDRFNFCGIIFQYLRIAHKLYYCFISLFIVPILYFKTNCPPK